MKTVDEWKQGWVNEQMQSSENSFDFWMNVADNIILGRNHNEADIFQPMGKDINYGKPYNYLVDLYNKALKFEKQHEKKTEAALPLFEILVAELFNDAFLYDHLEKFYNKGKLFKDASRIERAAQHAAWPKGLEKPKISILGVKFKIKPMYKKSNS